jgi:hypothetical protein
MVVRNHAARRSQKPQLTIELAWLYDLHTGDLWLLKVERLGTIGVWDGAAGWPSMFALITALS